MWDESTKHGMPLDFRSIDLRTGSGSLSHKQPMARAIGRSAEPFSMRQRGLVDSFLLACLGWRVHAVERHPIVFALLREACLSIVDDMSISPVVGDRLTIHNQDAVAWLDDPGNPPVDAVYLDPMFETRRSSALPKKPAQILRHLVGRDNDVDRLFRSAMDHAKNRVIVKRSIAILWSRIRHTF